MFELVARRKRPDLHHEYLLMWLIDSHFCCFVPYLQYKAIWYMLNLVSSIESVQSLGIVFISFYAENENEVGFDFELHRRCVQMITKEIPIHHVANNAVLKDTAWKQVFELWNVMHSQFLKFRSRNICGEL